MNKKKSITCRFGDQCKFYKENKCNFFHPPHYQNDEIIKGFEEDIKMINKYLEIVNSSITEEINSCCSICDITSYNKNLLRVNICMKCFYEKFGYNLFFYNIHNEKISQCCYFCLSEQKYFQFGSIYICPFHFI